MSLVSESFRNGPVSRKKPPNWITSANKVVGAQCGGISPFLAYWGSFSCTWSSRINRKLSGVFGDLAFLRNFYGKVHLWGKKQLQFNLNSIKSLPFALRSRTFRQIIHPLVDCLNLRLVEWNLGTSNHLLDDVLDLMIVDHLQKRRLFVQGHLQNSILQLWDANSTVRLKSTTKNSLV